MHVPYLCNSENPIKYSSTAIAAALHGLPKQPEIAHNAYFQLQIREVL
jgi:hypothetical protein